MYSYFSHPNSVKMSYFEHFKVSFIYSYQLFIGSIKALIHAIIPSLYITSTSDVLREINKDLFM